jgi:uncharacterized membrane protein YsdA (DUF1294 family)
MYHYINKAIYGLTYSVIGATTVFIVTNHLDLNTNYWDRILNKRIWIMSILGGMCGLYLSIVIHKKNSIRCIVSY